MVAITFIFGLACTLCQVYSIGVPAMLFALAWAVLEKIVNSLSVDNGCGMWLVLVVVALLGLLMAVGTVGGSLMMEGRL